MRIKNTKCPTPHTHTQAIRIKSLVANHCTLGPHAALSRREMGGAVEGAFTLFGQVIMRGGGLTCTLCVVCGDGARDKNYDWIPRRQSSRMQIWQRHVIKTVLGFSVNFGILGFSQD